MRVVSPSPHQAAPQTAQLLSNPRDYCLKVVIIVQILVQKRIKEAGASPASI
jgi:hypothetical protein